MSKLITLGEALASGRAQILEVDDATADYLETLSPIEQYRELCRIKSQIEWFEKLAVSKVVH